VKPDKQKCLQMVAAQGAVATGTGKDLSWLLHVSQVERLIHAAWDAAEKATASHLIEQFENNGHRISCNCDACLFLCKKARISRASFNLAETDGAVKP